MSLLSNEKNMKVLILAGGFGTRLGEETDVKPKPMVEIGGRPILWHIMKGYSNYGFNEFIVLCGYKGNKIKEYFANYYLNASSVTFDLKKNSMETVATGVEPWKVTLLDTGDNALTGARIKKAQQLIGDERFMLTYGDGVSNVNISDLIREHSNKNKLLTMTTVQPEGRFGTLEFGNDGNITAFKEKPKGENGWINGGFFVCEPQVFDYINVDENCVFEREPLEKLASEGQINCYKHSGFWKCMDTLADKNNLEALWQSNKALWKVWN